MSASGGRQGPEPVEDRLTAEVLARLGDAGTPRVRQLSEALVRHLHAFVREVEPTMDEWAAAIDFLTRTGQMCTDRRQEFILLSDVLGVSMLVDAINHRRPGTATENTVLGPFYVDDPEERPLGADLADGAEGVPMLVEGTVSDVDGAAVAGAVVDTWQADAGGYYDVQLGEEHRLRARLRTGQDGRFSFWSLVPCSYPIPEDGPVGEMLRAQGRHPYRPAHVHFMISAPGFDKLVTHVFVAGDPYLSSDAVFGVKESLIRELDRFPAGSASDGREVASDWARLRYDFVLVRA